MSVTADGLQELYPAFASVSDTYIEVWLTAAEAAHTSAKWGNVYDAAMYAWAAHHLTLYPASTGGDGAPRGPVSSESVGGISRSYADPTGGITAAGDAFFKQTSYGLAYLALRRTRSAARARVVNPSL